MTLLNMIEIHIDGACSGNPGEAAIGVIIRRDGQVIKEIAKSIGVGTNNIAEYSAMICALQEASSQKDRDVKIYTDSELVYKQLKGEYQVKHPSIKPLFEQVQHFLREFPSLELKHVPREQNKDADRLATSVLKKQAKVVAPSANVGGEESPSSKG